VIGGRVATYSAFDPRGPVAVVAATPEVRRLTQVFRNVTWADRPVVTAIRALGPPPLPPDRRRQS